MAITADQMDAPRRTLMWIAGAFLSMFLFAAVIALSYSLGAKEGGFGDPPLIRAPEGPYKIVPEQPGGQSFPHQNIGVYNRVSGEQTTSVEQLLPPTEQPLDPRSIPQSQPRVIDPGLAGPAPRFIPQASEPSEPMQQQAGLDPVTPAAEPAYSGGDPMARDIPEVESVPEGSIADLIRQNTTAGQAAALDRSAALEAETNPGLAADARPSIMSSEAKPAEAMELGQDKVELVMALPLPEGEPVASKPITLEPVIAEDIKSDPARVVDGTQLPIAPAPVPPAAIAIEALPQTLEELELVMATPQMAALDTTRDTAPDGPKITPDLAPETAMANAPGDAMAKTMVNIPLPVAKPVQVPAPQPARAVPEPMPETGPETAMQIAAIELPDPQAGSVATQAMPAGAFVVQIGAYRKKAEAEAAWRRAARTHKDLIAQLRPAIQRADLGSRGIYFRLRIGPLDNKAQARSLCKLLKKRKQACLVPRS